LPNGTGRGSTTWALMQEARGIKPAQSMAMGKAAPWLMDAHLSAIGAAILRQPHGLRAPRPEALCGDGRAVSMAEGRLCVQVRSVEKRDSKASWRGHGGVGRAQPHGWRLLFDEADELPILTLQDRVN
jgi:hypothetical protein